ncbi:hypothetical protein IV498_12175 [Paenarthrobacter sp. Z7-10]|uniref:hypothetical protein n=1 Tax=Paenarthrobacter sp. Z7-10 TaxID=2787635 RepID=UPI0022A9D3E7|nr:hypothetical protein [Paenarthrobacter sp. Z7-10]MCZ2403916.1 hypothetical protein [Paenarthrobacter sp. Z7-10]
MKHLKLIPPAFLAGLILLALPGASLARFAGRRHGPMRRWSAAGSESPERGDVPGWVMITLMSAVLVAGLLAIAGPALQDLFNQAISQVTQGK